MRNLRKVAKIILVFLLVCALTVSSAENARAAGAEGVVEVVGGSIAAGGIGAALATICPPAMIILGLVMVGQGIDIALTEASEAEGKTKLEFLQSKFEEFCDATNKDFEATCNRIAMDAKILEAGTILLSYEATKVIAQFISNAIYNGQVVDVGNSGNTININGNVCPVLLTGESINYKLEYGNTYGVRNDSSDKIAVFAATKSGSNSIFLLTDGNGFEITDILNDLTDGSGGYSGTEVDGGLQYMILANYRSAATLYVPYVGNFDSAMELLNGEFNVDSGASIEDDTFISDGTPAELNPTQGQYTVINPGLDIPGLEGNRDGVVGVSDYLDTLGQAINGIQDLTIAIQDLKTGVIEDVAVGEYDVVSDVSVSSANEQDVENESYTAVLDVDTYPTNEQAQEALNGMQFDLTRIFPFCIPFDLVHLVQKFDVTPVAPHVQISVPLPGIGTNFELDIDLSDFDGVARVARMMELIASIVGLAMVTRGLIRG